MNTPDKSKDEKNDGPPRFKKYAPYYFEWSAFKEVECELKKKGSSKFEKVSFSDLLLRMQKEKVISYDSMLERRGIR